MAIEQINSRNVILVSQSPRRVELLKSMGIEFSVRKIKTDESFDSREPGAIVEEIALKKLRSAQKEIDRNHHLLIAADTLVWADQQILGKPRDKHEAWNMLWTLSGNQHSVFTAVAFSYGEKEHVFHEETKVYFSDLSEKEIIHYIDNFLPYDKAGSYGIQEWIGRIGVQRIEGSYENVVGLPTARLYSELLQFIY